ncbi:DUF6913 domain-containing protein [Candidatus Cardinium hertigii]|uniref:DUF6913 domain-containing protein n=1 Tax=Candidatus Cardinium hertigii TaxID=247481 RepID=UPI0013A5426C|nr:hypothetical protein [Candidatus Cardinium hertigii]
MQWVTRLSLKRVVRERSNVGLSKAATIGVLYSYQTAAKHDMVQRFVRDLKNLDKKVSVLCYITEQERMHPSSGSLRYTFGHEAFTVFGKVSNELVRTFIKMPFDYLFHVDMDANALLDYIVANNQAKCRVGHFDSSRKHLFEVMVKVKQTNPIDNIKRLASQMLHYTGCMEN